MIKEFLMMWEDVHDMLHVGSMVKLYTSIMPIIYFKLQKRKILWVIVFPSLQPFFWQTAIKFNFKKVYATGVPRQFNGERTFFSTNGRTTQSQHTKQRNWIPTSHYTQILIQNVAKA